MSSSSEMGFQGPQFGFSGFGNTFATMTQASVASADFGGIGMATPTNIVSQQLTQEGGAGASVGIPQNRNENNLGGALLSPAKDNSDNISRSSFNRNENFQVTSSGFSVAVAPTKAGGTGSGESLAVFNGIGDISISGDGAVSFVIPPNAFSVSNSDAVITLSAGQADGSILPNWIVFDPKTGQFEGEIPADFEGGLSIVVTAIDQNGNEVQTKFEIKADESENLPQSEDQSDLFFRKKNVIKLSLTDNETHPNFSQQLMQGKGFDKIPNQFHIREAVRLLAYAG